MQNTSVFTPSNSLISALAPILKAESLSNRAYRLVLARFLSPPKTSANTLLSTTVGQFKQLVKLKFPALSKVRAQLDSEPDDAYLVTNRQGSRPLSRMGLWRMTSKVQPRLLITLRRLSQTLSKEIEAWRAVPAKPIRTIHVPGGMSPFSEGKLSEFNLRIIMAFPLNEGFSKAEYEQAVALLKPESFPPRGK